MNNLKGFFCKNAKDNLLNVNGDRNNVLQNSQGAIVANVEKYGKLFLIINQSGLDKLPRFEIEPNPEVAITNELIHPFSTRQVLADEYANILKEKFSLNIFGDILSGKSVMCKLVAAKFPDFNRVTIDASDADINSITVLLLNIAQNDDKSIIIIDNCPPDLKFREAFLKIIGKVCCENCLVLINSTTAFNPNTFSDRIPDKKALPLTAEELKEMLPADFDEKAFLFIQSICNGQPALCHVACIYLKNHNWSFDEEALSKILFVTSEESIRTRIYQALKKIICDDEDRHLLNRLLLFDGPFSDEEGRRLANINPAISSPDMRINNLNGWISKLDDRRFIVADVVRKTLSPDLNKDELARCTDIVVKSIFAGKALNSHDVFRIIHLLNQAAQYSKLAAFYTNVLVKLSDQNLLEHPDFSLIKSLWLDKTLPSSMEPIHKASMRITRIIVDPKFPDVNDSLINDLVSLLPSLDENPIVLFVATSTLQIYYANALQVDLLLKVKDYASRIAPEDISKLEEQAGVSLDPSAIPMFALHSCSSFEDLLVWIEIYLNYDCCLYEGLFDFFNIKIAKLLAEASHEVAISYLDKLYEKCNGVQQEGLYPIMAIITFHHLQLLLNDPECAYALYRKRAVLEQDKIGRFLLNTAMGIIYFDLDQAKAGEYLDKALASNLHEIFPLLSFKVACLQAQTHPSQDPEISYQNITKIADVINDHEFLIPSDKIIVGLCSAYATYKAGAADCAVSCASETAIMLLSQPRDDDFKINSTHFALVADFIRRKGVPDAEKNFIDPSYFSSFIRPANADAYYDPRRVIVSLISLLMESYSISSQNHNVQVSLLNLIIDNFDEFNGICEYLIFTVPIFSILLYTGNKKTADRLVALIDEHSSNLEKLDNKNKLAAIRYFNFIRLFYALDALVRSLHDQDKFKFDDSLFSNIPIDNEIIDPVLSRLSNRMSPVDIINCSAYLYKLVREFWQSNMAVEILSIQIKILMIECEKKYPNEFNTRYNSLSKIWERIKEDSSTLEYIKRLIQGFYYHLKDSPNLGEDITAFIES